MLEYLKIVPLESLISFESCPPERVNRSLEELTRIGRLKNPLLVSPFSDRYLLLDDSAVLFALKQAQVRHVPIQVATAETLQIRPWQKVVDGWSKADLMAFCQRFPRDIRLHDHVDQQASNNQAEIRFKNDGTIGLDFSSGSYLVRADMFARLYFDIARICNSYRAGISYESVDPFRDFPRASAVIFPPYFSLDELAGVAGHGLLLPRSLIRVDQPGRVLGIDYPMAILQERVSLEEKESFLRELVHLRLSNDCTAYYFGKVIFING